MAAMSENNVDLRIAEMQQIYKEKGLKYGRENYKVIGSMLTNFFPTGVTLRTHEDFCRFFLLGMQCLKLSRSAANFVNDGHPDSEFDLALYSMIALDYNDQCREHENFKKTLPTKKPATNPADLNMPSKGTNY